MIAPSGIDSRVCSGPLEEFGKELFVADVGVDECALRVDVGLPIVRAKILFRSVILKPPAGEVAVAPPDPLQSRMSAFPLH
jgi:hypothetical protein